MVQCGGKLHGELTGPEYQVFAHALRGLSSAKITRAKTEVYQNHAGDGCAVRCSYKADDGFLYPLEKAFFYVHKPPMCINHNDIEYVEFQRQGGTGAAASSVRTFDLLIRQRSVNSVRLNFDLTSAVQYALCCSSGLAAVVNRCWPS